MDLPDKSKEGKGEYCGRVKCEAGDNKFYWMDDPCIFLRDKLQYSRRCQKFSTDLKREHEDYMEHWTVDEPGGSFTECAGASRECRILKCEVCKVAGAREGQDRE